MTTNFIYQKSLKNGILNWRCAVKSCKEPLKTDSECTEINEVNASKAMNLTKERLNASKNVLIFEKESHGKYNGQTQQSHSFKAATVRLTEGLRMLNAPL